MGSPIGLGHWEHAHLVYFAAFITSRGAVLLPATPVFSGLTSTARTYTTVQNAVSNPGAVAAVVQMPNPPFGDSECATCRSSPSTCFGTRFESSVIPEAHKSVESGSMHEFLAIGSRESLPQALQPLRYFTVERADWFA